MWVAPKIRRITVRTAIDMKHTYTRLIWSFRDDKTNNFDYFCFSTSLSRSISNQLLKLLWKFDDLKIINLMDFTFSLDDSVSSWVGSMSFSYTSYSTLSMMLRKDPATEKSELRVNSFSGRVQIPIFPPAIRDINSRGWGFRQMMRMCKVHVHCMCFACAIVHVYRLFHGISDQCIALQWN